MAGGFSASMLISLLALINGQFVVGKHNLYAVNSLIEITLVHERTPVQN